MTATAQTEKAAKRAPAARGRGRGRATGEKARAAVTRPKPQKVDPNWQLDPGRYSAFGTEMAQAAAQAVKGAGNFWDRCRTLFIEAHEHGRGEEAVNLIFQPGESVKGRKAPWYRTYKSILTSALTYGIQVGHDTGVSGLQAKIKEAKDEAADNDPAMKAAKDQQLLGMFERMAQGCLNRGIAKKDLAAILARLSA